MDGSGREVKEFGATTPQLESMAEWMKERNVESVANALSNSCANGEHRRVLDCTARGFRQVRLRSGAGEYARVGQCAFNSCTKCAFKFLHQMCFQVLAPNVPGRKKTDRVDCIMCFQLLHRWIQRLHSCGLLTGSFRPPERVCMLRTLVRDKKTLVAEANVLSTLAPADWLRRMQKWAFNSCPKSLDQRCKS